MAGVAGRRAGESATLSVPGAEAAITVDFVPAPSSVVSMARLGRPSIPHATAAGKATLAFGPAQARPLEGELVTYTERTITDPAVLRAELEEVREQGIAEAVGEREVDLATAAPVLGRGGELVSILGLQGPAMRPPAAKRRAMRDPVRRAAAEVGRARSAAPGWPAGARGRGEPRAREPSAPGVGAVGRAQPPVWKRS